MFAKQIDNGSYRDCQVLDHVHAGRTEQRDDINIALPYLKTTERNSVGNNQLGLDISTHLVCGEGNGTRPD